MDSNISLSFLRFSTSSFICSWRAINVAVSLIYKNSYTFIENVHKKEVFQKNDKFLYKNHQKNQLTLGPFTFT